MLQKLETRHLGPEAAFGQAFEDAWQAPSPELLVTLLHPDITLYQPVRPAIEGKDNALREFTRLFRWLPGLRGEIDRSISSEGAITIEWRMHVPIGRRGFDLHMLDAFTLQDGLAVKRRVYFDQVPLILAVLAQPID